LGLGECAAALKQDDVALKTFERIYRDPKSEFGAQALWGAATLRQRRAENAEAQRLFKRLRTQYPASFEATAARDRLEQLAKLPQVTPTPTPKARPKAARYYVQVGAFSKKITAQKLQRTLKTRRYPVLLVPPSSRSHYFIVKTGPYKTKALAEGAAHKLSTREKLPQRIVEE
jgi:cell division septation protein DedD